MLAKVSTQAKELDNTLPTYQPTDTKTSIYNERFH